MMFYLCFRGRVSTHRKLLSATTLLAISLTIGYNLIQHFKYDFIVEFIQDLERSKILLNITDFHFKENPKHLCSEKFQNATQGKTIITVVHSARINFLRRKIIRQTYGAIKVFRGWSIQTIFSMGLPSSSEDETIADNVKNESKIYGDVVMGSFIDTYRNLSVKQLSGYKWVTEYCPEAQFYLKADDDVVVNIFHAIDFLSNNGLIQNYYCNGILNLPVRNFETQYFVTHEEYKYDKYPKFCGLGIYITPVRNIQKILSVSNMEDFLYLEDVFVTGILRERANREIMDGKPIDITHTYTTMAPVDHEAITECVKSDCFGMMIYDPPPNGTCVVWNLVLEARNFSTSFPSTCLSLF